MSEVINDCEVLNCPQVALMVYIEGCDRDEVTDFLLCVEHAYEFCISHKTCDHGHAILEKLVKMIDGSDPIDARFYHGEWVAVYHQKVVFHGNNPQALIDNTKAQNLAGTNVYHVTALMEEENSWIG